MNEGSIEHRTNFRPPTPMPGLSARLDGAMETMAKKQTWNLIAHGTMIGFTLICVLVVWWSISFRLPQLEDNTKVLRQANQLRNQVEQLRLQRNVAVEKKLLEGMQTHEDELFQNRKEVVEWLRQQIASLQRQGISMHYTLQGVRIALITHHAMGIQLKLAITRPSAQHNGYARLVRAVARMRHHGTALHVEQLTMHGGSGGGASSMDLLATVWMR